MNITIFGADGRTGIPLVEEALSHGHLVCAFVRAEQSVSLFPPNVRVVVGDILNREFVLSAVQGSNAVVSVIGHISHSDPFLQTKGIQNVVDCMNECSVTRIISLTGTGVRISGDTPSLFDRIANFFVEHIDPERVTDGREHAQVLKRSNLEWTIFRVLKLGKENPTKKEYTATEHGPARGAISRTAVAHAILDALETRTYIAQMPVLSPK